MFFLQGAKGFYDLLLISAYFFCFFIRRSKTANLVQNLVYIILGGDNLLKIKPYLSSLTEQKPAYNSRFTFVFPLRTGYNIQPESTGVRLAE